MLLLSHKRRNKALPETEPEAREFAVFTRHFPGWVRAQRAPSQNAQQQASTSTVKEVFIAIPPALTLLRVTGMKGFRRAGYRAMHLF